MPMGIGLSCRKYNLCVTDDSHVSARSAASVSLPDSVHHNGVCTACKVQSLFWECNAPLQLNWRHTTTAYRLHQQQGLRHCT